MVTRPEVGQLVRQRFGDLHRQRVSGVRPDLGLDHGDQVRLVNRIRTVGDRAGPVSYTHLDVYKRQKQS